MCDEGQDAYGDEEYCDDGDGEEMMVEKPSKNKPVDTNFESKLKEILTHDMTKKVHVTKIFGDSGYSKEEDRFDDFDCMRKFMGNIDDGFENLPRLRSITYGRSLYIFK